MIQTIAIASSVILATCELPQLWQTFRTKQVRDLSLTRSIMWFLGELGLLTYCFVNIRELPLLINYGANTILSLTMLILILKYRNKKVKK